MRRLVASLFVSLEGVVESPERWTGPYVPGPLVVSKVNPRYFTVASNDLADGQVVYLKRVGF
jgi:hypothetical protein